MPWRKIKETMGVGGGGELGQKVLWERVAIFRMDLRKASLRGWCLNKDPKEGAMWVYEKRLQAEGNARFKIPEVGAARRPVWLGQGFEGMS